MEYDGSRKCITYANNGSGPNKKKKIFEDPRKLPNELLNPKRFNALTAQIEKEGTSTRTWNAQYQQQPEGAGGRILKRAWWREWSYPDWHPDYRKKERELPSFFEVFQSYDTAFEEDEEDDYSVRTTWGLFNHEEVSRNPKTGKVETGKQQVCAMLLERMKERLGFGDLRDKAVESNKIWEPDLILIEKKASGHSLIQELRKKKLPIKAVLVKGDLIYRTHMSSIVLQKGGIFYLPRPWTMDVIDECAKFPGVDHDDQVASCVIAWQYMRRYRDLQLVDDDTDIDDAEELDLFNPKIHRSYYG
jgi:predicted phage terminase large subunit-like protein